MLKGVQLEELKMEHYNDSRTSYNFQRASFFKYIEKSDCREILMTNNLLQVLTGIVYHNGIENMPITLYFQEEMNFTEFVNIPTIRLFPSIFKNIRTFIFNKKIVGIWASTLLEEAKLAYEQLYREDKIDNSIKAIFRINTILPTLNRKPSTAFEIISDERLDKIEDFINDKLVMYLLWECDRNNGCFGVPLSGWKLEEIERSLDFLKLKKFFNRVFVIGCGEIWRSTHLIVKDPKTEDINRLSIVLD
ncbi:hypothetical protein [Clostridium pasteurianum]|uniref:Uncharacterized protein n=1 Tax=Clostridium pasteurianum BC1 TaxID=86416 RepID=R4JZA1_CLOPA|nr:hypothetical protein [Clostridium pasteurianum]AGK96152.1 hypothetical protein Clopa_1157 [Clostridium pasteurianum BC1]